MTIRKQLEGVYKQTNILPQLLQDEIKIPLMFQSIYDVFLKLKSQDIQSNISYQNLLTYQNLFNIEFLQMEIEIFSNLNSIFDTIISKRNK